MLLTVRTPSKVLFEGDVSDVTIPTRIGQITVLPHHMPLATIVESGIVQFTPDDQSLAHDQTFVFDKKKISMAIGGGIAYIDGQNLIILGTAGSK
ncbi:MAG: F0F1 ATP synthase subunit epsilon [Candidatus Peribacteria bacterium]|nr:MAG: F0F1 ATP synthase subunit epsilon [Candidatus Peribacteria bacterium]